MSETGKLFVCATPIGNLGDASERLIEVLSSADFIACEDTRVTGKLLFMLGIKDHAKLLAHHAHNEQASTKGIIDLLLAGNNVALVSDAGTPAINDPGALLVDEAHNLNIEVVSIAGPSAVSAALSVSGFTGNGYHFAGFLPRKEKELSSLLSRYAGDLLVAFEAPTRVLKSLAVVADIQPDRNVCVCREITKHYEEIIRGTAASVIDKLSTPRGEIVMVLEPVEFQAHNSNEKDIELAKILIDEGIKSKRACQIVAAHSEASARDLYNIINR